MRVQCEVVESPVVGYLASEIFYVDVYDLVASTPLPQYHLMDATAMTYSVPAFTILNPLGLTVA